MEKGCWKWVANPLWYLEDIRKTSGTLAHRAAALWYFCLVLWIIFGSFGKMLKKFLPFLCFMSFADVQVEQNGWLVKGLEESSCLLRALTGALECCSFQYLCAKLEWKGCKLKREGRKNFPLVLGLLSHMLISSFFFCNVSSGRFDFEEHYCETWDPENACFYTSVNVWIPDRYLGELKASRQF